MSSTGHLLLAGHFLGFESAGKTFEVVIQLGAVLALITVYATTLLRLAARAESDDGARRALVGLLLAFLPAVVVVSSRTTSSRRSCSKRRPSSAFMLIVGGIVLLLIDRFAPPAMHREATGLPCARRF